MSDFIKVRDRGQITLPKDVRERLHVGPGDYLRIDVDAPTLVMRPARLVTYGTPEADALDREAEEEIAAGRYESFDSVEELMDSLGWGISTVQEPESAGPYGRVARPLAAGQAPYRLAELLLERSGGGREEALDLWKAVGRALAEQVDEAEDESQVPAGQV